MTSITTIANNLNKDDKYIEQLCKDKNITIEYDQDGAYIADDQAKKLLQQEYETPTRYNFREVPCTDVQRYLLGNEGLRAFWIGNVIKYLYRRQSIGDIKKAAVYLDMLVKDMEANNAN